MPTIVDNNFANDTHAMRAERLLAIKANFALIQPELAAPVQIETWTNDCYEIFMDAWTTAGTESNQREGATLDAVEKGDIMKQEYQVARTLAMTLYENDQMHLKDFKFDFVYPQDRLSQIERVQGVLDMHAKHLAAGITHLLPTAIITRLTNALSNYEQALVIQKNEKEEATHAVAELSMLFEADMKKLIKLRAWWKGMFGKNDHRVGMVGMVNPSPGGNSGPVPVAPTNLTVDVATMVFSWDPILENTTSYILQTSIAGVEWETIYSGTDNFVTYVPPTTGLKMYRALGRNQNGLGIASGVMQYNYHGLPAPDYISLSVVNATTGVVALNWGEVSGATRYQLFSSEVATGSPAPGEYTLVGEYAIASYSGTFNLGFRHWFYAIAGDIENLSLPSDAVYVDL